MRPERLKEIIEVLQNLEFPLDEQGWELIDNITQELHDESEEYWLSVLMDNAKKTLEQESN